MNADTDLFGYEVDAAGRYTERGAPPYVRRSANRSGNMGFIANSKGGGDFKPVPPGLYAAYCVQLVDLGTQISEKFGASHKIRITWEIHGEDESGAPLMIVGREGDSMPMVVGGEYTVSLGTKANLRKLLASWRGRDFTDEELAGFDISNVLGAPCMVNITNSTNATSGKTYANVAAVAPMPKGMPRPERAHPLVKFDLDAPDMAVFNSLPEWVREKIEASPEWQELRKAGKGALPAGHPTIEDDDVPF